MADVTDDICLRVTPARATVRGTDGDNLSAWVSQELRRPDKFRALGDFDEPLLSNGQESIYKLNYFLCPSLAAAEQGSCCRA